MAKKDDWVRRDLFRPVVTRPLPPDAKIERRGDQAFVTVDGERCRVTASGTHYATESRVWYCRMLDPRTGKRRRFSLNTPSKPAAIAKAKRLMVELPAKAADPNADKADGKLTDHLEAFLEKQRGRVTEKHRTMQAQRIRRALDACEFVYWRDIWGDKPRERRAAAVFHGFLKDLTKIPKRKKKRESKADDEAANKLLKLPPAMSNASRNHYRREFNTFVNWMASDEIGLAPSNPFSEIKQWDAEKTAFHYRPLSDDELREILAAARAGADTQGVTGAERAVLYQLAAATGLRFRELTTLTWANVQLGDNPSVTVLACYAKNGERADQPIATHTAAMLERWRDFITQVDGRPAPEDRVFAGIGRHTKSAKLIQFDATVAGVALVDAGDGSRLTFHSLRHVFITAVDRNSRSLNVTRELARHSNVKLTQMYTHPLTADQRAALEGLPRFDDPDQEFEALRATGTDSRCPSVVHADDERCLSVAENGGGRKNRNSRSERKNTGKSREMRTHRSGFEPETFGSVDRCSIQLS